MGRRLQFMLLMAQILSCCGFVCRAPPRPYYGRHTPSRLSQQSNPLDPLQQIIVVRKSKTVRNVLETIQVEAAVPSSNVTAAVLRRMVELSTSRGASYEDRALAKEKSTLFLENINQTINNGPILMNLYALADILTALSKLDRINEDTMSLADRICNLIDEHEDDLVHTLKPVRLVQCLQALASLDLYHSSLINRICCRLQKGDALAMLEARHLAVGIKALAMLGHVDDNVMTTLKASMRRWRKQAIRQTASVADICQTLYAARLWMQQTATDKNLDEETTTMVYTLLRELYSPSPKTTTSRFLTAGQVAEIIVVANAFHVNATNPIFDHLMKTLNQEGVVERATVPDIARILSSMERLRLGGYPLVGCKLGLQFHRVVQKESVEPRSVCNILRAALHLHQRDDQVLEPFVKVTIDLLMESSTSDGSTFLQSCADVDLASLVRFLSLVRCEDEAALVALAERILQDDILESCSPKAASMILAYFTTLVDSSTNEMLEMRSLLSELFHGLGTCLLSAQLTPAETSAALQAYAKASYVQDMGIFDHLASHLETMLDDCTIRQVTQALWSCAKMVAWESNHGEEGEGETGPPYLKVTKSYVSFLATRTERMNTKDIAQVIWALGWLRIDEREIVSAFALRASQLAGYTSQEVANILWGLSRSGYDNVEIVSVFTDRMLKLHPSSQEAAMVLYALGRMEMRDETVFSSMCDIMMEQVESASAQAIANALWAYRTVEIPPPRELMDSWVIQKLGLDGVPSIE